LVVTPPQTGPVNRLGQKAAEPIEPAAAPFTACRQ